MGDTTKIVVACLALEFGFVLAAENVTLKIPDNLIKLIMPNGSVEISIKSQIGNESQKAMELLVKSLKSAIDGLGYSLSRTTTNRLLNAGRNLLIGVSDGNGSKQLIDKDLINSPPPILENLFTQYVEHFEYGLPQDVDDDSKPLDYANPVDQDESVQTAESEQERNALELNYTSNESKNQNMEGEENFDKYMMPAEDEYENFGKDFGSSAPTIFERVPSYFPYFYKYPPCALLAIIYFCRLYQNDYDSLPPAPYFQNRIKCSIRNK